MTTNFTNCTNSYCKAIHVIRVIRGYFFELCFNPWALNCHYIGNHNYEFWILNSELTEDCELIKDYELNKKAPEVRDTSGGEEFALQWAHIG